MSATKKKSASDKAAEEINKHYRERRDAGLPAHQVQEHAADPVEGISIKTVGGVCYVSVGGGDEFEYDQAGVFTLVKEFQAAFQAIS